MLLDKNVLIFFICDVAYKVLYIMESMYNKSIYIMEQNILMEKLKEFLIELNIFLY